MEGRKYYDEGWGAGKCPRCSSYNTDSAGYDMGKDCMDCGHSWGAERGGHPDATHMQNKYPKVAPSPSSPYDAHNKKSYGTHGVPLDDKWSKTFNPEEDEDK